MKITLRSLRWVLPAILIGFLLFLFRNFSFQYSTIITYAFSLATGVVFGIVAQRSLRIATLAFITFLTFQFLPSLNDFKFYYGASTVPVIIVGVLIYKVKYWLSVGFGMVYSPIVLYVIFLGLDRDMAVPISEEFNLEDMQMIAVESGDNLKWAEGKDAYFLSYWHIGCGYCVSVERDLKMFSKQYENLDLQMISVESQGVPYVEMKIHQQIYHNNFKVCQDKNRVLPEVTGLDVGPMWLIADKNRNVKKIYKGYSSDLKWFGPFYWRYVVGTFG